MKAAELFRTWKSERHQERPSVLGDFLSYLASHVLEAQLDTGARVLDVSDFRELLAELGHVADQELQ